MLNMNIAFLAIVSVTLIVCIAIVKIVSIKCTPKLIMPTDGIAQRLAEIFCYDDLACHHKIELAKLVILNKEPEKKCGVTP